MRWTRFSLQGKTAFGLVEEDRIAEVGTVHNAVPDYSADEPRYMRRVQVMATKDYAGLLASGFTGPATERRRAARLRR